MTMQHADDIDRALASEEDVGPSPGFQARVMRSVRGRTAITTRSILAEHSVWPTVMAASVLFPMLIAQQLLPADGSWMLMTLGTTWAIGWFFTHHRTV